MYGLYGLQLRGLGKLGSREEIFQVTLMPNLILLGSLQYPPTRTYSTLSPGTYTSFSLGPTVPVTQGPTVFSTQGPTVLSSQHLQYLQPRTYSTLSSRPTVPVAQTYSTLSPGTYSILNPAQGPTILSA